MYYEVSIDLIHGIKKFKEAVRWKDFHRQNEEEKARRLQTINAKERKEDEKQYVQNYGQSTDQPIDEGLKTGMKPTKINMAAPRATDKVEIFLKELGNTPLHQACHGTKNNNIKCGRSKRINALMKNLREMKDAVVAN